MKLSVFCSYCFAVFVLFLTGCSRQEKPVAVLYTSQDQVFAEPILKKFTAETGIKVEHLFDSESAKTAGLAHRLRIEKVNPQCDLFWSNEELHTRLLVRDGVVQSNQWSAFGYRTRRIVINTNLLPLARAPQKLSELTNLVWNGKVAIAYPLFGTTASHFLALRQLWGENAWLFWCHGLVRNGTKVVDGNSVVVKLVGHGEAWIGLTDSDDIAAGKRQGFPIVELPLTEEMLAIPNTLAFIKNAPHPQQAQALADYLQNSSTVKQLVELGALEGADLSEVKEKTLRVDWEKLTADFQDAADFLRLIFVRT